MRQIRYDIGQKIGFWTVISVTEAPAGRIGTFYLCDCVCGNRRTVAAIQIKKGTSRSCGCGIRIATHGNTRGGKPTPEYRTWQNIKKRCYVESNPKFQDYGARGIKLCERWHSFENFLADMGEKPSAAHSIERDNFNGDYGPSNCRWATAREQSRNKRNNRWITAGGRTMLLVDWATELGVNHAIISTRLRRGWSEEDAVLRPIIPTGHRPKQIQSDTAVKKTACPNNL